MCVHGAQRDVPLLVSDDDVVRSWSHDGLVTVRVGRRHQTTDVLVIPRVQKGTDEYVVNRHAMFIINSGIESLVYMADQYSARRVFTKAALANAKVAA